MNCAHIIQHLKGFYSSFYLVWELKIELKHITVQEERFDRKPAEQLWLPRVEAWGDQGGGAHHQRRVQHIPGRSDQRLPGWSECRQTCWYKVTSSCRVLLRPNTQLLQEDNTKISFGQQLEPAYRCLKANKVCGNGSVQRVWDPGTQTGNEKQPRERQKQRVWPSDGGVLLADWQRLCLFWCSWRLLCCSPLNKEQVIKLCKLTLICPNTNLHFAPLVNIVWIPAITFLVVLVMFSSSEPDLAAPFFFVAVCRSGNGQDETHYNSAFILHSHTHFPSFLRCYLSI